MAFVLRSVHISAFVFILGYNCLAMGLMNYEM